MQAANSLQLEISTKCNALCPTCIRTNRSLQGVNPAIPRNSEMPKEVLLEVFRSRWAQNLRTVEFCGTLDEPLLHSNFLGILEDLYNEHPHVHVSIHTNGGSRGPSFFKDLATMIKKFGNESTVRFGIDGLGKTNQIYRYGVKFDRVWENLKTYTNEGAPATWQSLIFPWNRHQIRSMEALAKSVGCSEFWVRPDRTEASKWGAVEIEKRRLEKKPPSKELPNGNKNFETFVADNIDKPVSCVYKDIRQMVFISWDGNVWPCCFWSHARYENKYKKQKFQQTMEERYSKNFNNLAHHSFDDILQHDFFQNDLLESWEKGTALKWRCVEKCSIAKKRTSDGKRDDKKHYQHVSLN